MSFTGKATYTAGSTLPEIAEDVSDLVAISSPYETPLLDALGDGSRVARSTVHEWLEDELLPDSDAIDEGSFSPDGLDATTFGVAHAARFVVGDIIAAAGSGERMLVTDVDLSNGAISVVRSYGGTSRVALIDGSVLNIFGNAALEGADAAAPRFTSRWRKTNYTQIFSASVEVSGSELAVRQIAVADELEYQKHLRLRELLRSLESTVINGVAPASYPEGSASVRRSMRGIRSYLSSNVFKPGVNGFPSDTTLTEAQLNLALRTIWQNSSARVDLIVVGGKQKRSINGFVASNRRFSSQNENYKDLLSTYESDYGVCRIVLARAVPAGTVLLLDSARIEVLPLAGRHFHYKALGRSGDRESGQLVGEYTLELRNENAHGVIEGLA
ncbi:MAG: DUF5309 family protein [Phycisphaerales bacterium]|nr:DUF5309 family protein [Phycisphaerales bacterium]